MIEDIAKLLYFTVNGLEVDSTEEEQIMLLGAKIEPWEEAAEWLRDDYRHQAKKVLEFIYENGNKKTKSS